MQAPAPSMKIAKNDFLITLCNSIKEGAAIVEKDTAKIIFRNDAWFRLFEVDPPGKMDMMQINQLRKIELTDDEVKSTVGAGDSMVAGIVYSLANRSSLKQALQYGVACGTAATMNPGTELCHKRDADRLYLLLTQ